jgi:hypothetical protein
MIAMRVVASTLDYIPFRSSVHAGRGCRRKALPTSLPALAMETLMYVIFEKVDYSLNSSLPALKAVK